LKGSSGNLGVTGVQGLAAVLESAIKNGAEATTLEPQIAVLEAELARICAAIIARVPDEAAVTFSGKLDFAAVRKVLAELEPLLAAADIQANEIFSTHAPLLKAALGASGVELERHIRNFAYADALETVKRVRAEIA
jgi:HPt (histidine-containing phosphotransfer) domain-containing protein